MPTPTRKSLETTVRREVEALFAAGATVQEVTARVFGPKGLLSTLAADRKEREAFVATPVAAWLRERLAEQRGREIDEFERETASLSGRMTLVMPKSLHAALKREAAAEGVSLAELLRLKASVPLRETSARLAGTNAPRG